VDEGLVLLNLQSLDEGIADEEDFFLNFGSLNDIFAVDAITVGVGFEIDFAFAPVDGHLGVGFGFPSQGGIRNPDVVVDQDQVLGGYDPDPEFRDEQRNNDGDQEGEGILEDFFQ